MKNKKWNEKGMWICTKENPWDRKIRRHIRVRHADAKILEKVGDFVHYLCPHCGNIEIFDTQR